MTQDEFQDLVLQQFQALTGEVQGVKGEIKGIKGEIQGLKDGQTRAVK